jgi:ferritin-like metal-binding protein YciE
MAMNSLKEVYVDQLQDLYSACKQARDVTATLQQEAGHEELGKALHDGVAGIDAGAAEIGKLCKGHGVEPGGEHCKGMEGLVAEARAHVLDQQFGNDDTRDAMIITQYQRMAHYAIAGYGCLLAFARRLELDDDARVLERCLDSCYDGDRRFTDIATSAVNEDAAA